jgi:FlgO protein
MIMKKKIYFILILFFSFGVFSGMAAEKNIIAVFNFKGALGRKSQKGRIFSLLLFSQLSNYDSIKMVERLRLARIMKERKLNRSFLVSRKYLELAVLVNANYIVTGRIYKDEDEGEITVNLKLTKCSDGKIFGKSFSVPLTKKDEYLENIAKKAAVFIVKSFDKKMK